MENVSVSELRRNVSTYLGRVEHEDCSFLVERRGKRIAELGPAKPFNNQYGYVWEKLYLAASTLVGAASIQQRLLWAALSSHTLKSKDFPDDLQDQFETLWQALTSKDARNEEEGALHATILTMSDDKASLYADQIFELFHEIVRRYPPY